MKPFSRVKSLLGALADLVAPFVCPGCDAPHPAVPPLCTVCRAALEPAQNPPPGVLVPYAWGGPLSAAIVRAKFGDHPALAESLGSLLVPTARTLEGTVDRVIAVPLHPHRLAVRGFNQSVELARAVATTVHARQHHGVLVRVRDTPSQRDLGRTDREANVHGAFRVTVPGRVKGARVVLVDDVVTTGATLRAAADALTHAGATVVCLALARAERLA